MIRVLDPIRVEFVDGRRWVLLDSFKYHVGGPDSGHIVLVPAGFTTDFASIPRGLWNTFPPTGPYAPAALVHDWLYTTGEVLLRNTTGHDYLYLIGRKYADDTFREVMEVIGVGRIKRNLMYRAVRLFGGRAWDKHRAAEAA